LKIGGKPKTTNIWNILIILIILIK
jgi:hypothetical protein